MYLLPLLLCFSSIRLCHYMGSPTYLGFSCLVPAFPASAWGHLDIWALPVSIPESLTIQSSALAVLPYPLMRVPLAPLPLPSFPQNFLQGYPMVCLRHLLTPPCVPPVIFALIARLLCAHLKNQPQHHPLYHCPLFSSN